MNMHRYGLLALLMLMATSASAQVGIFDNNQDIGDPDAVLGFAQFDDGRYEIDVLQSELDEVVPDSLHYAYNEMSGSFSIQADPAVFAGRGGVMIRNGVGDSDAHASLLMAPDFNIWPHFRFSDGGGTVVDGDPEDDITISVKLVKVGNSVHYYRVNESGGEDYLQSEVIQFNDTVLAGLAVGGNEGFSEFRNVSIEELPLNVHRTLPSADYEPGMTMTGVTVTASVRDGETADATINEIAPVGSIVTNVQVSAGEFTITDNEIVWNLEGQSEDATLTYDLEFPDRSTVTFPGTFTGTGVPEASFMGGPSVLPSEPPQFAENTEPIEINYFFPTLFQVEDGTPGTVSGGEMGPVDDDAFGLGLDPRTSGIIVIDTDGSSSHVIAINIDIPQDGTYYFFGLVRGDDGNSDSWHFDIDAFPTGGEDTRWNVSGNKQWGPDWVEQEEPNNDPRPFELTAGTHTIYVANREDSAMIDWLVATTNPNISIANFDINERITEISGRTISDPFIQAGESTSDIEISTIYRDHEGTVTIHEVPPTGFVVSNTSVSGGELTQNDDGSLSWDISGIQNEGLTLSYTVTAPANETNTFKSSFFDGNLIVEGEEPFEIAGNRLIVVEGVPVEPTGLVVYYFQNISANEFPDTILESHLINQFGAEVRLFDDTDLAGFERPADLSGADLAIVSGSVGSSNIGDMNYHINDPVPLITHESFLYDDYSFSDTFDSTTTTEINIIDNEHPITEGLDLGLVRIFHEEAGVAWAGSPPDGVRVLATPPGEPDHASVWVIEADTVVNGITVPGMRFGLWSSGFTNMTNEGIDLMNRIIAYALGVDVPEPPTKVENFMLY